MATVWGFESPSHTRKAGPFSVLRRGAVATGNGVIPVPAVGSALEVLLRSFDGAGQPVDSSGTFAGGTFPFWSRGGFGRRNRRRDRPRRGR